MARAPLLTSAQRGFSHAKRSHRPGLSTQCSAFPVVSERSGKMGPPRDRLAALQSKAYFDENDDYALPLEEENEEMGKFFQDIEELRDIVQAIENDIKRVRDIQHQMLSQPQVSNAMKNDLEESMAGIKKKANQVRQRLKAMEIENEEQVRAGKVDRFEICLGFAHGPIRVLVDYLGRFFSDVLLRGVKLCKVDR